jgi:hypothetical protein
MRTSTQIIVFAACLLLIVFADQGLFGKDNPIIDYVVIPVGGVLGLVLGLKALYYGFCYLMNSDPHGFGPWPHSRRTISRLDRAVGADTPEGDTQTLLLKERKQKVWDCVVAEWLTQAEIKERIGGNEGLTTKAVRVLHEEGRLERIGRGIKGDPYRYFVFLPIGAGSPTTVESEEIHPNHSSIGGESSQASSRQIWGPGYKMGRLWASLSDNKRAAIGMGSIVLVGLIAFAIGNSGTSSTNRNTTTSSSSASPTTASPVPPSSSSSAPIATKASPVSPSPSPNGAITVGQNVIVDASQFDEQQVTTASSELDFESYIAAIKANDLLRTVEMKEEGRIFFLPNGTHALVLEFSPRRRRFESSVHRSQAELSSTTGGQAG